MVELTKKLLEATVAALKQHKVPLVTKAILTRDAFLYGHSLHSIDEPSYVFYMTYKDPAKLTRDWFMYGVYG